MLLQNIPSSTKKLFWSCNPSQLDSKTNKTYIIHQVLQYGDLQDFKWLQQIYSSDEIGQTFANHPRATYQPASFHFVTKFLLNVNQPLKEEDYVSAAL